MQTDTLGKVLPQILIPFARQWAERSGITVLSKLLVDEQFLGLISRYADEFASSMPQFNATPVNSYNGYNGYSNGRSSNGHQPGPDPDYVNLNERVLAMEAQQQAQQALFESLRAKIRPLALALGCCPDCVVGVDGCPKCLGQSRVGQFTPDPLLLRALVLYPLNARGVPLSLNDRQESPPVQPVPPVQQSINHSVTKNVTKKRRVSHAGRNGRKLGS